MKNIRIFAAANPIGVWCSWLAFLHGVQAVARSSRATPTESSRVDSAAFLCGILTPKLHKKVVATIAGSHDCSGEITDDYSTINLP